MAKNEHHVVHNPDGGWDIKKNGAQRSSGHHNTKSEAEKAARQIML